MLKKMVIGRILLVALMAVCGWDVADAAGPVRAQQVVDGSRTGDDHGMPAHDLFDRVIEIAGGAANEHELWQRLENDPLVQEAGINPDADIMISGVYTGDCYLTPLICLFETHTPDLSCVYNCIGMRGSGEVTRRHVEECDFLAGCILFENCLTLCITIIPYDLQQPVIWW
jgi:hypothetical protein